MKKLLTIAALLISFSAMSQKKITVTNEAWNCGGYFPITVKVIKHNNKPSVYFDWLGDGVKSWKTLSSAKRYWEQEGTEILKPVKKLTLNEMADVLREFLNDFEQLENFKQSLRQNGYTPQQFGLKDK